VLKTVNHLNSKSMNAEVEIEQMVRASLLKGIFLRFFFLFLFGYTVNMGGKLKGEIT
jgi:hypothetical protein